MTITATQWELYRMGVKFTPVVLNPHWYFLEYALVSIISVYFALLNFYYKQLPVYIYKVYVFQHHICALGGQFWKADVLKESLS